MKRDYLLRVSNTTTKKVIFKKWFENVTYKEAMYRAQDYLAEHKSLKNNFHSGIEIILFSNEKGYTISRKMKWIIPSLSVSRKMEWINPPFSNEHGYFEGWDYSRNGKLIEKDGPPKVKTAFLTTLIWIGFFLFLLVLTLIFSANDKYNILGFLIFFLGVIYSAVLPLHKSLFDEFVENKKQMVLHSILLELPIWLAGVATVYSFFGGMVSLGLSAIWVVFLVIFAFAMKILIEVVLDRQKLHERKLKSKT